MDRTKLITGIVVTLLGTSAAAENYVPLHARSMAMGGTGVATSRSTQAPLYNPALLVKQAANADLEILFPIIGGHIDGFEDLIDDADDFDDENFEDDFDTSVDQFNEEFDAVTAELKALRSIDTSVLETRRDAVVQVLRDANAVIDDFSQHSPRVGVGVGFSVAVPSSNIGFAFMTNSTVSAAANFNYKDSDTVSNYADGIQAYTQDVIDGDLTLLGALITDGADNIDALDDKEYGKNNLDIIELDEDGDIVLKEPSLISEIEFVGLAVSEIGLSFAKQFKIQGYDIAIGITPKYQRVDTVHRIAIAIDEGESDFGDVDSTDDEFKTDDTNLNLDIGAAYELGNWMYGASIRNMVSQEYKTVEGLKLELDPHARVGAAYRQSWYVLTADLDLTEQKGVYERLDTQYLAFGSEMNLSDIFSVRLGYRHNLSDSDTDIVSVGLGLTWGFVWELAAVTAVDGDESGFTMQMGLEF